MNNFRNLRPFPWFCMNNFPFIEQTFDEINIWNLLGRVVGKLNEVIENTNKMGGQVEDLTILVNQLKEYMEHYFDNLDVQEEINNKLDEMVESGELEEIISAYLRVNAVFGFNNVAEMLENENLTNGCKCKTLGYYEKNDGGSATYLIRNRTFDDVIDNGKLHLYSESLVAELIIEDGNVNLKQFGARGDGETDDTTAIKNAIACSDNVYGLSSDLYYVTESINIENKNLYNINIKAEPFEVETGNTYFKVLNMTGNNNLHNVRVESAFEYIPSIEIYADPTSETGLASNVQAFCVTAGITNFYNCKANFCWAFYISHSGKVNIYDFIGTNLEMGLFNSSSNDVKVYNSKFNINKLIDSIYYHHIYVIQGTNTEYNNCEFTESGSGNVGNHYHGYSTSFTEDMNVTGKLVINNCNLITEKVAGQINGVDLYVNGGSIEAGLLLADGNLVDKPTGYFKDCNIIIKIAGSDYQLAKSKVDIRNCHIICTANGTKSISSLPYKIYNSVIDCLLGTFSNHITANENNLVSEPIVMNNCIVNSKSYSWCYPYYCTDIRFKDNMYNLTDLKETTNPANKDAVGFMYNCIFKNWTIPLNMSSENTFKYKLISDGIERTNIS